MFTIQEMCDLVDDVDRNSCGLGCRVSDREKRERREYQDQKEAETDEFGKTFNHTGVDPNPFLAVLEAPRERSSSMHATELRLAAACSGVFPKLSVYSKITFSETGLPFGAIRALG